LWARRAGPNPNRPNPLPSKARAQIHECIRNNTPSHLSHFVCLSTLQCIFLRSCLTRNPSICSPPPPFEGRSPVASVSATNPLTLTPQRPQVFSPQPPLQEEGEEASGEIIEAPPEIRTYRASGRASLPNALQANMYVRTRSACARGCLAYAFSPILFCAYCYYFRMCQASLET